MLKTLSRAEGDGNSQPPTPRKVSVFGIVEFGAGGILLGLVVFIVALLALNYFNILSLSKMNPKLFSLLPTSMPIPGSCKIVEEKFCPKGELLEWSDGRSTWITIGFKLSKNTTLFSPFKGQTGIIRFDQSSIFKGFGITISDPDDLSKGTVGLAGNINLDKLSTSNVASGDPIGHIGENGVKNLGEFNLIVSAKKDSPGHELLRNLFPEAFEKPAKKISS